MARKPQNWVTNATMSPKITGNSSTLIGAQMIEIPSSALVVTAHPDDIDFGGGGTIAKLRAAGTDPESAGFATGPPHTRPRKWLGASGWAGSLRGE